METLQDNRMPTIIEESKENIVPSEYHEQENAAIETVVQKEAPQMQSVASTVLQRAPSRPAEVPIPVQQASSVERKVFHLGPSPGAQPREILQLAEDGAAHSNSAKEVSNRCN